MMEGLYQPLNCLLTFGLFALGVCGVVVLIQNISRLPKLHRRVEELAAEIGQLRRDLDSRVPPNRDPAGPSPERDLRPPGV
jgi:hypothetical protein